MKRFRFGGLSIFAMVFSTVLMIGACSILVIPIPPSSDASLDSISLSSGILMPEFNPETLVYTASVGNEVETIEISATAADPDAVIESGGGSHSLDPGENEINLVVTGEDGSSRTYTIIVTREEPIPDTTPPAAVGDLTANAGDGAIVLTWNDPDDEDLDHIEITWIPDGTTPQTVGVGERTFTAGGLTNGGEYLFSVIAVDTTGNQSTAATVAGAPMMPPPTVLYVMAGGSGDGSSWAQAMGDLQGAIEYAATFAGSEPAVWVSEGTYVPAGWPNGGTESREMHFSLRPGVKLYGGFAGTEASLEERGVEAHPTVLNGDLNGDDEATGSGQSLALANQAENLYHVLFHPQTTGLDASTGIDGFVICGGNADGSTDHYDDGGGMFNDSVSPTITNTRFEHNYAKNGGGVAFMNQGHGTIENCTFVENSALSNGGGAYYQFTTTAAIIRDSLFQGNRVQGTYGGALNTRGAVAHVSGCLFVGNHGGSYGGGVHMGNGTVANCVFSENTSNTRGGGLYVGPQTAWIYNSVFVGNSSGRGGGLAMWRSSHTVRVANCTITGNSATYGGSIYFDSSAAFLDNLIAWGNTGTNGDEIYADETYPVDTLDPPSANNITVNNSIIEGYPASSTTASGGEIRGTFTAVGVNDPLFADAALPTGTDAVWGTGDDGLIVATESPAIDGGNAAALPADVLDLDDDMDVDEAVPVDLTGAPRVQGSAIDMGAYEVW